MNPQTDSTDGDSGSTPVPKPGSVRDSALDDTTGGDSPEGIPPEVREMVSSFLAIQQHIGPAPIPLLAHADESHLHKILDGERRDKDQAYEFRRSNRRYYLILFWSVVIVLGAAVFWLLPRYPEFLDTILKILLGFAGGFGAGYGLKSRTG